MRKIYQIDCSARKEGSTSRKLAQKLLQKIKKKDEVIAEIKSIDFVVIFRALVYTRDSPDETRWS